jgi:3-mercaptopyruvate sulfurtransferase SseA
VALSLAAWAYNGLPDVLVDADWVQAHLDDPSVVPVEVDNDTSAYDKGHIKGAVNPTGSSTCRIR